MYRVLGPAIATVLAALSVVSNASLVRCLAEEPGQGLMDAVRYLHSDRSSVRKRAIQPSRLTVDTHFHIVHAADEEAGARVTDAMVDAQFEELSSQYSRLGIFLRLVSTTYTSNTSWATNGDDLTMKRALRRGEYSSLNIYFQTQLARDPLSPATSQFLGFSTMPVPAGGEAARLKDGCNVHAGSMPGGYVAGNNLGKTAVHEVGHWFGLLHTFHGNSCEGEGDHVDDTRQEMTSTSGCPVGKNSCPELEGLDPISNFMDYSSDECYQGFTAGQQQRMHDMYQMFREGV